MLGSKSDFFFSPKEKLEKTKKVMIDHLLLHNTSDDIINIYLDAYDYFITNPSQYDGTTILKDIEVIPDLDIWAMLHDYLYVRFNVSVNFKQKYYSDIIFTKELERMGHSWEVSWIRFGLLTLSGIFFTPYQFIKGKRMSKEQRKDFKNICNLFLN